MLQVLDRLGDVAPVLLEQGGVIEVLRLDEGRAGGHLLALADRQVDSSAVDELLFPGVFLDQVEKVTFRLLELTPLESGHPAVEILLGVLGVAGELLQRRRHLRGGNRGRSGQAELLHLLFEVVDPRRQRVGEPLNAHLSEVVPEKPDLRVCPAFGHVGPPETKSKNGVF